MAGCCQSGVISLWGLCTCGLHLVLTTKLTTNAASAVSVVPRETLEKSAFGGILVPAIYSVHRVQIPPSAPAKRDIQKDVSFCFTQLILPFPRENHPLTNPIKRFILIAIKKAVTKKKLFFRGQREGRPRLKAPRQGHGPYHFRAACDEQDGYRPLQRSKATAYAGSLPPILRCRSLKYRPYSCAPAPCLDERYPAIRSGQ